MNPRNRGARETYPGAVAALALAALATGCAQSEHAEAPTAVTETRSAEAHDDYTVGYWAPLTAPTWVRIDREASFVLAEAEADLLVVQTDKHVARAPGEGADEGPPLSRITWMFAIPTDSGEGDRFAFVGASEGGPPQGWALEAGNVRPRRVEISGFVTVLERSADRIRVDIKAFPIDESELPDLLEQVECVLAPRPGAVAMAPLDTRSGAPLAPIPPKDPPRRRTDAVWPWGELFGDYPPPRYATE